MTNATLPPLPGWKPAPVRLPDEPLENCPVCGEWLKPKVDCTIRQHPRTGPKCAGSGTEDRRPYLVRVPGSIIPPKSEVRYQVSGRRGAEIVAKSNPDAIVYERV